MLPKGLRGRARFAASYLSVIAHMYDAEMMPFILRAGDQRTKKANPELRLIAVQNYALLANKAEVAKNCLRA